MIRFFALCVMFWCSLAATAQPFRNEWIDFNKTYFRFAVRSEGIVRIPRATLSASGLGDTPAEHFQLWRQGEEVPIFTTETTGPLSASGYIEFYGRPNDGRPDTDLYLKPEYQTRTSYSLFTDTALYYLTVNPTGDNRRIRAVANNVAQTTQRADSFFMHTYNHGYFEQYYGGYSQFKGNADVRDDPFWTGYYIRSSNWDNGEGYCSNGFNLRFPLSTGITNLRAYSGLGAPPFVVKYTLSSNFAGSLRENSQRTVTISLSDSIIDTKFLEQIETYSKTISNLSPKYIVNDGLTFRFTADQEYYWDNTVVNALFVNYARRFHFGGQRFFRFSLPANNLGNHLRIAGFAHGNVAPILYDQTSGKRYLGVLKGDSALFQLESSEIERQLEMGSQQSGVLVSIASLSPVTFRDFRNTALQGDYLIISNPILYNDNGQNHVEAYRQYRASAAGGSYNAVVYSVDELAEQFGYGIRKSPLAIRNFLRYALQYFAVKPKFVLLLGKGSNYLDYTQTRNQPYAQWLNSVPTWGWPGSDQLLVSQTLYNPTPLVPIGRVSAATPGEIAVYLDKLKKYEALAAATAGDPTQKTWQKDALLLVGGEDEWFAGYMKEAYFKTYQQLLSDTAIGANAPIYTRVSNPNFAQDIQTITQKMDSGVGFISYYGHSSASSIDFNLGNPEEFKNSGGRYPIFMAFGCKAGNIFDHNSTRLVSKNVSVSDNYTFARDRGSIAFISSNDNIGDPNPPYIFTTNWYNAAGKTHYGKSIGEIQQEATRLTAGSGNLKDDARYFGTFVTLEQAVLHGDPAIVPFPYPRPDYTTSDSQVKLVPVTPSVANDSVWVRAYFGNTGKFVRDSVVVELKHLNPHGQETLLARKKLGNVSISDSIQGKASLKGLVDAGSNSFVISIDPEYLVEEISKDNNVGIKVVNLDSLSAFPVFPYRYAIADWQQIKLTASTANGLAGTRGYRFELDTTTRFNSPLLVQKDTISVGGAISIIPGDNHFANGRVYYWRVAPLVDGIPMGWQSSSFLYQTGNGTGFNQSHYYQHLESNANRLKLDSNNRSWQFGDKLQNFYINHGIYGTSGFEDSHFSLTVNGLMLSYSACLGQSIIFNVFDSLSFKPWSNASGGRFGSGGNCGGGREFNFEFKYFNHVNRKLIMDFLDSIPKGNYVVARLVVDPPHDSLKVEYWKRDTAIYGSGKSLYHALFNQGFYALDSLNRTRTFGFVFRKDDTITYKPFYKFSDGIYDRVTSSVFAQTADSLGALTSPLMGPASSWRQSLWENHIYPGTPAEPESSLKLWGVGSNGQKTLLRTFTPQQTADDISAINATQYPYMQFELQTREPVHAKPLQLDHWRLYYQPVADGAISAADYFLLNKDTLYNGSDTLQFGVAFKNVSLYALGQTTYKLWLGSPDGREQLWQSGMLRSLGSDDTALIKTILPIVQMGGRYYLRLVVNDGRNPMEQEYFNNTAYLPFYVTDISLPVTLIDFQARAQQGAVLNTWQVTDETGVKQYDIEHATPGTPFRGAGTIMASRSGQGSRQYQWIHQQPSVGDNFYRLKTTMASGEISWSAVRKVTFAKGIPATAVPNPFNHTVRFHPGTYAGSYTLSLFDARGRLVLNTQGAGVTMLHTGNLPPGIYWLHYYNGKETSVMKLQKD